jgi:hypothetical protein
MKIRQPLDLSSCSVFEDRAFTVLFALILFLGSLFIFSGSAFAASTSVMTHAIPLTGYCNDPNPHCYATRTWPGHTGGSSTLINPYGSLNCQSCNGFIDVETWFEDTTDSQCTSTKYGECWVEGGISTWPANDPNSCHQGYDSTCGFWADNRPYGGNYNEHPLYNFGADGVNLVPYLFYITIKNDSGNSSSGSTWDVIVNIYKNGTLVAAPNGQSKSNTMNVNNITIGSELSDSNGSAGTIYFQDNQWMDTSGNFHYQTTTGNNYSTNPPPYGYWVTNPCNCQGNTGGSFDTYDS